MAPVSRDIQNFRDCINFVQRNLLARCADRLWTVIAMLLGSWSDLSGCVRSAGRFKTRRSISLGLVINTPSIRGRSAHANARLDEAAVELVARAGY
jgi:hypothetical protein